MKNINNIIKAEHGFKIRLKSDLGDIIKGEYIRPYLCDIIYLPKNSSNDTISLYEEIDERDIDLHALTWEKELKAKLDEDEAHRKAYEDALKELESSSSQEDIVEE